METILDRLKIIAEREGITISKLEITVGASKGAFRKNSNLGSQWIQHVVEYFPTYNADWILMGRGKILLESIPDIKVSDNNEYLVKRFEEIIRELGDMKAAMIEKDRIIADQAEKIERLEREKKAGYRTSYAAHPVPQLKSKKK